MVWSHGDNLTESTFKSAFLTCWMACKRMSNYQSHWRKWRNQLDSYWTQMYAYFSPIAVHQPFERLCLSHTNTLLWFKTIFCTASTMWKVRWKSGRISKAICWHALPVTQCNMWLPLVMSRAEFCCIVKSSGKVNQWTNSTTGITHRSQPSHSLCPARISIPAVWRTHCAIGTSEATNQSASFLVCKAHPCTSSLEPRIKKLPSPPTTMASKFLTHKTVRWLSFRISPGSRMIKQIFRNFPSAWKSTQEPIALCSTDDWDTYNFSRHTLEHCCTT